MVIGNSDINMLFFRRGLYHLAVPLTDSEILNVSTLARGQGLVCSASAKLFVDFVAADYEKAEITTDAKSFYEQAKARERQQKAEQDAKELKANSSKPHLQEPIASNIDSNGDELLNVTI